MDDTTSRSATCLDAEAFARAAAWAAGEFHNAEVRRQIASRSQVPSGRDPLQRAREDTERAVGLQLLREEEREVLLEMFDSIKAAEWEPSHIAAEMAKYHERITADHGATPLAVAAATVAVASSQQIALWVCEAKSGGSMPTGVTVLLRPQGIDGGDGNGGGGGGGASPGEVILADVLGLVAGGAVGGVFGFVLGGYVGAVIGAVVGGVAMGASASIDDATRGP